MHPNDRKRIGRLTALTRLGIAPHRVGEGMWSEGLRHPTTLVGLDRSIATSCAVGSTLVSTRWCASARARRCVSADAAGASRTARAAIGFEELLAGDVEAMKSAQWRYARRQLTWMRKMEDVRVIDRGGRSNEDLGVEVVERLLASP